MKITLVTVGKIKEKYLEAAIAEYSKRLNRYCKLEIVEVADEKTLDGASEAVENQIRQKELKGYIETVYLPAYETYQEGERILAHIKEDAYVIALAIDGKQRSSEEMAAWMEDLGVRGESHLQFIIGGSLGLSQAVLNRADTKISFSRLTFPHQLMRVILLEQIYRSFRIIKGEPYHK